MVRYAVTGSIVAGVPLSGSILRKTCFPPLARWATLRYLMAVERLRQLAPVLDMLKYQPSLELVNLAPLAFVIRWVAFMGLFGLGVIICGQSRL